MNILEIKHRGYHGFFSYCSVSLEQIIKYYNNNNELPDIVDMSKIFTFFKQDENIDISYIFFNKTNKINLNISDKINIIHQFENYNNINFNHILPIINNYFSLTDEINNIVLTIENKYNIDYENICCIFYRGNDKSLETIIPTYETVYAKINELFPNKDNINFLLQSDESEFFDFFIDKLDNYFILQDEIKHIPKRKTSINHVTDYQTKLILIKNFLAIVKIMSKCKYIICNAGNISVWITYFRGNTTNMHIFLNDSYY